MSEDKKKREFPPLLEKHYVACYFKDGSRKVLKTNAVNAILLHRENGPAILWDSGTLVWYQHGKRHRMDGPAWITRTRKHEWYIRGHSVSHRVNEWLEENGVDTSKTFRFNALDDQTAVCFLTFMASLEGG